ncbi:MAG: PAS domain-containing protein [Actinobacteria bacterium]|nr:MAG: PAS domain-containing protein [Actinomycetota bacterium]
MDRGRVERDHKPVSIFSLILLILMIIVILFLVLVQNVDRFSSFFGSTTFKIIFDVALVIGLGLFIAYIFTRSAEYNKKLEAMVDRLQKSNMLLQVLNDIQSSANANLDAQGLLEASLEAAMPLTSSLGTIYILDEDSGRLEPRARYGTETPLQELPDFGVGEGIVGMVARNGEPIEDSGGEGVAHGAGMVRYALPIKAGSRVMGVMVAGTTKGQYSHEEKTLLQAVSEVLGNSLTNAKLYNLTRRALDTTKKTQGYLESFIHEARMGVMVLDERGTVMIINQEAERFLGAQQKDLLGHSAIEVLRGMDTRGQQLAQGFQGCFREKQGYQYTQPVYDDPATQTVLVNVFPLFREGGELIGAAATINRS